jgi:uncharacterized membrane protein
MDRFYHITLLLLSPLCILGGEAIWQGLSSLFKSGSLLAKLKLGPTLLYNLNGSRLCLGFINLAVLVPYFLFNSGFVFEVAHSDLNSGIPVSGALSASRVDPNLLNTRDIQGANWLSAHKDERPVYADVRTKSVLELRALLGTREIPASGEVPADTYILLRSWNTTRYEIAIIVRVQRRLILEHIGLNEIATLPDKSVIYDNGGAQVLAP